MYEFYRLEFRGNVIGSAAEFESVINEATAYVDGFVRDRNNLRYEQVDRKYRMAICSVAEIIFQSGVDSHEQKQSESVGNHSVSYRVKAPAEYESEKRRKVLTFLYGTGLMYSAM